MFRPQLLAWLLFAGTVPGSDCRLTTGPDGFCAALRLDPGRADLRAGSTLRIRVNGLTCTGGTDCIDCAGHRRRFRWRSSAPDVAAVDSTGVISARRAGVAEIRFEAADAPEPAAAVRIVVSP